MRIAISQGKRKFQKVFHTLYPPQKNDVLLNIIAVHLKFLLS